MPAAFLHGVGFSRPKSREWIETGIQKVLSLPVLVSPGRKAGSGLKLYNTFNLLGFDAFLPAEKPGVD